MKPIGLYIHVPFCRSKCPYCDFYSMRPHEGDADDYTLCVIEAMEEWSQPDRRADTLYFGGGTPSMLGGKSIALLTRRAQELFGTAEEITVECNPSAVEEGFFEEVAAAGVNRISMGMQSAIDGERRKLGRLSDSQRVEECIGAARSAGIHNISLDLMLGVPGQTRDSMLRSVDFCLQQNAEHISAYMLKLEEGTYFYNNADKLNLPDDDETADLYLELSETLRANGYKHYEISNFAKDGFESRHNLKYWNCDEYLGIGPSAHSFLDGKRFYYPRDIKRFRDGAPPIADGNGGDKSEYLMLRLRLSDGVRFADYTARFGTSLPAALIEKAKRFERYGCMNVTDESIALTPKGFLLSNSIITELETELTPDVV